MRARIAALAAFVGLLPSLAFAFPFGGQIHQIIFCYNDAIYTNVGPPRGGPFIWTPSTRTYRFGPPLRTGQWLLGLAAPPYYCIVSKQPIIVWSGILMTMEGSSGAPAPAYSPGNGANGLGGISGLTTNPSGGTGTGTGGTGGTGASAVDHVLISEIYPLADGTHGGTITHQWIELFNPTAATATLSHWVIQTADSTYTIPNGTELGPQRYLVVAGTQDVRALWTIPSASQILVDTNAFGGGFGSAGDRAVLLTNASSTVDALSWGSDNSRLSPAVAAIPSGRSLIRSSLARDTDMAQDWVTTSAPTPGR